MENEILSQGMYYLGTIYFQKHSPEKEWQINWYLCWNKPFILHSWSERKINGSPDDHLLIRIENKLFEKWSEASLFNK